MPRLRLRDRQNLAFPIDVYHNMSVYFVNQFTFVIPFDPDFIVIIQYFILTTFTEFVGNEIFRNY